MGWKSLKALILSAPLCGANNEVAPKGNRMRKRGVVKVNKTGLKGNRKQGMK